MPKLILFLPDLSHIGRVLRALVLCFAVCLVPFSHNGAEASSSEVHDCDTFGALRIDDQRVVTPPSPSEYDHQKVVDACKESLEKNPVNPRHEFQLGVALLHSDFDSAYQHILNASRREYPAALYMLSSLLEGLNRPDLYAESIHSLRLSASRLGNTESQVKLAIAYLNLGDWENAIAWAREAIQNGREEAWMLLGLATKASSTQTSVSEPHRVFDSMKIAAENGSVYAAFFLSILSLSNELPNASHEIARTFAIGLPNSPLELPDHQVAFPAILKSLFYLFGWGGERRIQDAQILLEEEVRIGTPFASVLLGRMYELGMGTVPDFPSRAESTSAAANLKSSLFGVLILEALLMNNEIGFAEPMYCAIETMNPGYADDFIEMAKGRDTEIAYSVGLLYDTVTTSDNATCKILRTERR